jgi:dipeptidyl aminopeptidase/acylaminoacyl peptidase
VIPSSRLALAAAALALAALPALAAEQRLLTPDDVYNLKGVADPRVSPDGRLVAFTVTRLDAKEDAQDADVWMVPFAGGEARRLTSSPKRESTPRWSPDGRYLAFLSGREGKKAQVWLLDRAGGEAVRLTDYKADVSELAWSPDGKRLALVVDDVDPEDPDTLPEGAPRPHPKPIVIDRRQFKRDGEGYLRAFRKHLYLFDVTTRASAQLTSGPYDDAEPAWSPDGRSLAFTSNRTPDPDANQNTDVFVVAAAPGATPRAVTTSPGADSSPAWSPDGRSIAYLAGGDPKDMWYATNDVAVVAAAGGASRVLTAGLDRDVESPRFTPDGAAVLFLVEDGGNRLLASVQAAGGKVARLVSGERDVSAFDVGAHGEVALLESQPDHPNEVSALTGSSGALVRLTHVNDAFLAGIRLAPVERLRVRSADGTPVDAFLTRPPDAATGQRLPAVLRIHGGPASQFSTAWNLEWQILAAHGYLVVAANPRGSTGYGRDFSRAIWADWGNKDYQDVMAAVDGAVGKGLADPDRLGVGGWSYGGILTDYVITQTGRFKAATTGASETDYFANYGTDQYQYEWETELGLPWKHPDLWLKLSPFFRVEKVTTPTLVLGGADDTNVPLLNSEQLYQALKRLGRDTELVIYPGENHGLKRPSFLKDRYQRYLDWYDRYLRPAAAAKAR